MRKTTEQPRLGGHHTLTDLAILASLSALIKIIPPRTGSALTHPSTSQTLNIQIPPHPPRKRKTIKFIFSTRIAVGLAQTPTRTFLWWPPRTARLDARMGIDGSSPAQVLHHPCEGQGLGQGCILHAHASPPPRERRHSITSWRCSMPPFVIFCLRKKTFVTRSAYPITQHPLIPSPGACSIIICLFLFPLLYLLQVSDEERKLGRQGHRAPIHMKKHRSDIHTFTSRSRHIFFTPLNDDQILILLSISTLSTALTTFSITGK